MLKIAILGSCVSRDAIEFAAEGDFKLVGYFARSSLASLASKPTSLPAGIEKELSNFRLRMVAADHDKSSLKKLVDLDFDILILDLIDERFNLLEQSDGSIVTLSAEYMAAVKNKPVGRVIKSGSLRHIELWREGVVKIIDALARSGKLDRVVINKVFWSKKDGEGKFLASPDLKIIDNANQFLLDRYLDLERLMRDCKFFSYVEDLFQANLSHKWGVSPFHYKDEFYLETLRQLKNSKSLVGGGECIEAPHTWRVTLEIFDKNTFVARIHDYKANDGDEFAFYLMKGKERIAIKWYSLESVAVFEVPVACGSYQAVGFVRRNLISKPEYRFSDVNDCAV